VSIAFSYPYPQDVIAILIRMAIAVIKCGYYPLSAYKVIDILDYYLNLYARLNNAVINICNIK
jgi:hypothetical protein